MNLEMLALVRAEEQMHSDAWKRADRGEAKVEALPECEVCGEEYRPHITGKRPKVDICLRCAKAGWRGRRCPCCERPVKTWDIGKAECSACRKRRREEAA